MVIDVNPLSQPAGILCCLPVFEPLRARISRAFQSRPDPARLAFVASLDPSIAAEFLAAANSPGYGHAGQIYTAAEAIAILGWRQSESIANAVFDAQSKFKQELHSVIRAQWAHSLACAVVAAQVAPVFKIPEERAFAFGMLHDIGAWGLMATSPDAYNSVFRQGSRNGLEKLGAEECMMGIDHCKAGSWLVKSWGLPDEFAEAAAADGETINGATTVVSALVTIACRWAVALGFSAGHAERFSVRDAIRAAPPVLAAELKAASAGIGQKCRSKLLEYASEFDADTARLFARL